jgi:hypothetical protein
MQTRNGESAMRAGMRGERDKVRVEPTLKNSFFVLPLKAGK